MGRSVHLPAPASSTTRASDQAKLQDLTYAYDPVGNVTQIGDAVVAAGSLRITQCTITFELFERIRRARHPQATLRGPLRVKKPKGS